MGKGWELKENNREAWAGWLQLIPKSQDRNVGVLNRRQTRLLKVSFKQAASVLKMQLSSPGQCPVQLSSSRLAEEN